jgi:hypothetical protein
LLAVLGRNEHEQRVLGDVAFEVELADLVCREFERRSLDRVSLLSDVVAVQLVVLGIIRRDVDRDGGALRNADDPGAVGGS